MCENKFCLSITLQILRIEMNDTPIYDFQMWNLMRLANNKRLYGMKWYN